MKKDTPPKGKRIGTLVKMKDLNRYTVRYRNGYTSKEYLLVGEKLLLWYDGEWEETRLELSAIGVWYLVRYKHLKIDGLTVRTKYGGLSRKYTR